MADLDLIDRRILYELDYNSRQSLAQLSRKLRLNRDRIRYRIDQLTKKGIIQKFTVTTNPYKIGLTIYKTYLKLENNKQRLAELMRFLQNHPKVFWIAECDGVWDFIFSTFARSPKEFHEIHNDILSEFSDIVIDFTLATTVEVLLFRKNFLLNKGTGFFSFGGYPSYNKIDELDYGVLRLLSEDSRMNVIEIARKLNTTQIIVRHRIKKLEKLGIIVTYRIDIDLEKIGLTFFKAQLYLRKYDSKIERQFKEYCRINPHITYYVQQLGDCKLEIEFGVKDYKQFYGIISDIKEKFPGFIKNVEPIIIRNEYFKWVPSEHL